MAALSLKGDNNTYVIICRH